MLVPVESRVLLAVATEIVPRAQRDSWRREWDGEIWWWLSSHTGKRLELAAHCWGAVCDAWYLRFADSDTVPAVRRMAGSPGACLAGLAILLAVVAASSGLRETRRVLHGDPFAGSPLAVLSQVLPFMGAHFGVPPSKVADWNARAQTLDGAVYYTRRPVRGTVRADVRFFALLGTRPAAGSLATPGIVISYDFWQRRFSGDRRIVGRDYGPGRIVGVLPRDFWFLDLLPDAWLLGPPPSDALAFALARLKPGVTPAQAEAELRRLAAQVKPVARGSAVHVEPIGALAARPFSALAVPWAALVLAGALFAFVRFRATPRFAAFLAAKTVLSLSVVLFATVEFGSSWMTINSGDTNLAAGAASLWLFLAGPAAVLYWCWRDQRRRCRACLHRLTMPVSFGYGARILVERSGTELVCPHGHGTLLTTEGADPAAQWDALDSSWRELFVK